MEHSPWFEFEIERADDDHVAVVVVRGEIDLVTAPRVGGALAAAGTAIGVVLDLSAVGFLDSSGLSELLIARRELGDRVGIVCDPTGPVHRLMTVAGIAGTMPLFATRSEAVATLRRAA